MSTTLTYLFDPLCGWCYGASPTVQSLGKRDDLRFELAPTGLFSGRGHAPWTRPSRPVHGRIRKAHALMQTLGAQGVPAMVVTDERGSRLLQGDALYGGRAC
jgi:protein-disulfide isomerase-like protein with CxxC motif